MFRGVSLQPAFLLAVSLMIGVHDVVAQETLLVRGASPSASDHVTPLPEEGRTIKNVYQNRYFGLTVPLPPDWVEGYKGPPPSDGGLYVLAQMLPGPGFRGREKGTVLFSAQDMFFERAPVANAKELIEFKRDHLEPYNQVERPPAEISIAGHRFERFDYGSSVAQLHWLILATEIRCHAVEFVLGSRDPKLIENLIEIMSQMTFFADAGTGTGLGGGDVPLCIANYARGENLIAHVDPLLKDRRRNAIPVRIIIDPRGRVRHIHVISAFPDQAEVIKRALWQWRFKPYVRDGHAMEVETGLTFGSTEARIKPRVKGASAGRTRE